MKFYALFQNSFYYRRRNLTKLADIGVQRDIRSIQRQLESLSQQFEIERDMRDKPYGYRWKSNAKGLDLPILNEQQSLVLMLAKQYLNGILPSSIMNSMEAFFQQAEYNLVYDSHKIRAEWLNKVAIAPTSQPLLPAKINPEIFLKLVPHFIKIDFCRCIIGVFTVKNIRHRSSHWLWFNKDQVAI